MEQDSTTTRGKDVAKIQDNKGKKTNLINMKAITSETIQDCQVSFLRKFQNFFKLNKNLFTKPSAIASLKI